MHRDLVLWLRCDVCQTVIHLFDHSMHGLLLYLPKLLVKMYTTYAVRMSHHDYSILMHST